MNDTKQFHIGDILGIITGRLVSPDHMSGVHAILDWMAGKPIWTHQLPRVADEARPVLTHFYPDLANIEPADEEMANKESVAVWLQSIVAEHGEHRDVPRLSRVEHASIDPLLELNHMVGADRVIPVVAGGSDPLP